MSTSTRSITSAVLAVTAGAAVAATVSGTGPAEAKSPPQRLQIEQSLFTGDPWPFSYQTFSASTASPGHARITVDRLCNSVSRKLCLQYTRGGAIFWLNTSNGRTGHSAIPDGSDPGASVNAATGPGNVVIRVGGASSANVIVPAYGLVHIR